MGAVDASSFCIGGPSLILPVLRFFLPVRRFFLRVRTSFLRVPRFFLQTTMARVRCSNLSLRCRSLALVGWIGGVPCGRFLSIVTGMAMRDRIIAAARCAT